MRNRVGHVMRKNKGSHRPQEIIFVDTEAKRNRPTPKSEEQELLLGWAMYWRRRAAPRKDTEEWVFFTTEGEFWEFVKKHVRADNPVYLCAHNVKYDFPIMHIWGVMEEWGFELTKPYFSGMTNIMPFKKGKEKIYVVDNGNWWRSSLDQLGESMGFSKGHVDFDTVSVEDLKTYCRQDVNILFQTWKRYLAFLDENNLGNWGLTISSQAYNAFRHRFMDHEIIAPDKPKVIALAREAYHGGRASVFQTGLHTEGPYRKVDVNSMYPFFMRNKELPWKLHCWVAKGSIPQMIAYLKNYCVTARVLIETGKPIYPVEHKNHLIHPEGRFETVLSTPELEFALKHDHILVVYEMAVYEKANLFRRYIDFFYGLKAQYKAENDTARYEMAKSFINNLSGKFGQYAHEWYINDSYEAQDPLRDRVFDHEGQKVIYLYHFGSKCWSNRIIGEAHCSFPAIIGHVTAYARMFLWSLIEAAGMEHCFGCDTDSLLVDQVGFDRLHEYMHSTRLGALKVEKESETVFFRAPKLYAQDDDWKRKGIPKSAKYLGNDTWEFWMWPGWHAQGAWKKGDKYQLKLTSRHLTGVVHDGTVGPDGVVSPLQAWTLWPELVQTEETGQRIQDLQAQREALDSFEIVPPRIVNRYWSFRYKCFQRARNKSGQLEDRAYARMDEDAQELGFDSQLDLEAAIEQALNIRGAKQALDEQIVELCRYKTPEPEFEQRNLVGIMEVPF